MVQISCVVHITSEEHMQQMAALVAAHCIAGDCLVLEGDLGAGKTTFARGFIKSLCDVEEVISPTFTLVQTYPTRQKDTIWHFDLYRLETAHDIQETGLEEALNDGISLIEWPDLAKDYLPAHTLRVVIAHDTQTDARILTISGDKEKWQRCFASLATEKMRA